MISSFVENKNPKRRKPSDSSPPLFQLFWIGLCIIIVFTLVLLPFGLYWPISNSIWVLLIFFLPLVYLGIHFTKMLSSKILLAVVFALLSGGNVLLFLGDVIGYKTGFTSKFDILPNDVHLYFDVRYLYLREFYLDDSDSGSFESHLFVRRRSGATVYGPLFTFHYKRIRSISGKDSKYPLYAICYSKDKGKCHLSSLFSGGVFLRESIWERKDAKFTEETNFIIWKDRLDSEYETKGMYSILFFVFLLALWAVVVYLPYQK